MRTALLLTTLVLTLSASSQVPDYVNTNGLIAWFPMDGSPEDYGPNDIESTPTNAVPSLDRMNTTNAAIDLTAGGNIVFPNSSFFNDQSEFSVACWVNIPASFSGNGNNSIVDKGYTSSHVYPYYLFHLGCNPDNGRILWSYADDEGTNFNCKSDANSWSFNTWFHVTGVINPNRIAIFINGELSAELTGPLLPMGTSSSDVYIAKFANLSFSNSATPLIIDDLGFWTRSLEEAEIQALFSTTPINYGCTEEGACNYDDTATIDDGSCIPSGCMDEGACNYNADAECEGEACDYSCCPGPGCCGNGMHWDDADQICVITAPSVAPDAECTLLNLQELAEGYQILLAENAELDSLLADCNGTSTSDQSGPCSGEDVVTYHGYDYDIVEIGDQCWFAENLKTQQYSDATSIPSGLSDQEWITTSVGAFANFDSEYGFLYNWFSVSDPRGLCPNNWHVSEQTDWDSLESISSPDFPIALKSSPTQNPSWDGNNQLAFNAVPAGRRRNSTGAFDSQLSSSYFWLKDNGDYYRLGSGSTDFTSGNNSCCERAGFSVRCVKD